MHASFCATLRYMVSIVVAVDKNNVIGQDNKVPWRLRRDLVNLRRLTLGHTVILGRKTYDSMVWYYDKSGATMPGGAYIIITRNAHYAPTRDNARVVHSVQAALDLAKQLGDEEIFVIGGGSVYAEMLPVVDRIYRTEVDVAVDGDAYFPELDPATWREVSREHFAKDEKNQYDFDIVVLERE